MHVFPVILCGGQGTRLWPVSREDMPKQLITFFDNKSLLQSSVLRIEDLPSIGDIIISTNAKQRFLIEEQLSDIGAKNIEIILEPSAKSTAPPITLAAMSALERHKDAVLLVLSSDNEIKNEETFKQIIKSATKLSFDAKKFVLFGSEPIYPESGYGYIKFGDLIIEDEEKIGIHKIEKFIEKPSTLEAEALIREGYKWNSGIFVLPAKLLLDEMEKLAPDIYHPCKAAFDKRHEHQSKDTGYKIISLPATEFNQTLSDSIDYALIEKTESASVVSASIGWSDVGSWKSIYEVGAKDCDGNITRGDNLIAINNKNTFVFSRCNDRVIAALDLENVCIIDTDDATLITSTEGSQDVKKVVQSLQFEDKHHYLRSTLHTFRWGNYNIKLFDKHIVIKKMHIFIGKTYKNHGGFRSKEIFITSGVVDVQFGDVKKRLRKGDEMIVPRAVEYSIKNISKIKQAELVKVEF